MALDAWMLVILVGRFAWIMGILLISLDDGHFCGHFSACFRICVGSARKHDTQVRLVAGVP